jgi:hypothetical protein
METLIEFNIEEIKDFYDYTENCLHLISQLTIPSVEEIKDLQLDLPEKFLKKKFPCKRSRKIQKELQQNTW